MKTPPSLVRNKTALRRALLRWYRKERRDLPWRDSGDPYAVWVSEIILQQTRVEQGTPYIQRFLKRFKTVHALARAKEDAVLKVWEGLGYYTRARNLHKAARLIVNERDGRFPTTADEWMELPGVGRYTAGAVASIAFGERAPVLDGNVKRVLARLMDLNRPIDDGKVIEDLWSVAALLVRGASPGDFNQALMELGAEVCRPASPRCPDCPVRKHCKSLERGTVAKRPVRHRKKAVPHHEIAVAAIRKNGRYLLGKRPPKGLLGGLWEFPGGKVEPGETPEEAVAREVAEELGMDVEVGKRVATVRHAYSHFKVTLHVYLCRHTGGQPEARFHTELKWLTRRQIADRAIPKANHKFLDSI